jgi:hypothetical protein
MRLAAMDWKPTVGLDAQAVISGPHCLRQNEVSLCIALDVVPSEMGMELVDEHAIVHDTVLGYDAGTRYPSCDPTYQAIFGFLN